MSKKKILLVTAFFYPQNIPRAFRATELAKEFARNGHTVKVVTPKNPVVHEKFEDEHGLEIRDLGSFNWKGIDIKGVGLVRFLHKVILWFLAVTLEYPRIKLVNAVRQALKHEAGHDLLISIAVPYPIHWGVAASRSPMHPIAKTWVADCGDPFMGQQNNNRKKPFYFKYVEKWFCRKADFITVPTTKSIEGYYPEFHSKIRVIPQGFRFEDFPQGKEVNKNDRLKFGYAGGFIPGFRDPRNFLCYLTEQDVDFEFHLFCKNPEFIFTAIEEDKRFVLRDLKPRQELLEELVGMDFVINFENKGVIQTPSKLIDYAILDKPILSIPSNTLNKGVIDEFLTKNYANRLKIDNIHKYNIKNVSKCFIDLCDAHRE